MTISTTSDLVRGNRLKVSAWVGPYPEFFELPRVREDAAPPQGRDQATGAAYVSDGQALPSLGALAPLGGWASVATLLLKKTQEMTGFDPVSTVYDVMAWSSYLRKLASMPFLRVAGRNTRERMLPLHASMAAVREAFEAMCARFSVPTRDAIMASVGGTLALAEKNPAGMQKTNHQMVAAIVEEAGRVQIVQLWTSVSLALGEENLYRPLPRAMSLRCSVRTLDTLKCLRHAETLRRWSALPVEAWVKAVNSTPELARE
ncbi:hypothetical protein [Chondromyces apiculatus]|nr:hypothetical protein [Chondromyces apiculatus]